MPPSLSAPSSPIPFSTGASQTLPNALDEPEEILAYSLRNLDDSALSLSWLTFFTSNHSISGIPSGTLDPLFLKYCVQDPWNPEVCVNITLILNFPPTYNSHIHDYSFLVL